MNRKNAKNIAEYIIKEAGLRPVDILENSEIIMYFITGGEVDRYKDGKWILDLTPSFGE